MSSLNISPNEFRKMALQVVDACTEILQSLDSAPAFPTKVSGQAAQKMFESAMPEVGLGPKALDGLSEIASHSRLSTPRFFGYVFGSGESVAALGDLFASVLNQNVTAWRSGPAAVTIERTVVAWLAEAIGCKGFSGSLCGGGSSANLMGLTMAREAKVPANETGVQPGVIYTSTEAHMSIPKAAALLGLGHKNVRQIPVGDDFRIDTRALARAMDADIASGKKPIAVVACAGTVNTGAIDPLDEVAAIAHERDAWFHVDGAYGALAAIAIPELFSGLEQADSLSLDPHKWLYQPVDCGCLLYRDPGRARVAFSHSGEYARPLSEDPVEGFAIFEESLELSRRFRAMKLWLSLRYHGMSSFREAIRCDLEHARQLRERIEKEPSLELLAAGPLSAVCFRYIGRRRQPSATDESLNQLNANILRRVVHERGNVFISNAVIRDAFALRACIVNHRSSLADIELIVDEVLAAALELEP
jgi:aromatic-L-amino-acid/L-tryptophan decarboxylase